MNKVESKNKILIIDDNAEILSMFSYYLERAGYQVETAEDGSIGVKKAISEKPDLILMDVMMPVLDGFDACEKIKATEETKDIPVIFMTAVTDTVSKLKGFEAGAVDYVTKPINHEELRARIKTHLSLQRLQKELKSKNLSLEQEIEEHEKTQERLEKTLENLENSNKNLKQFASTVSHDLQAPLRTITEHLIFLENQYKEKLTKEDSELLNAALQSAKRMRIMIKKLLEYSRLGDCKKEFNLIDCNYLLDLILSDLRALILENQAVITRDPLPQVMGNDVQLEQLFQNLLTNALKFSGDSPPKIHVSAQKKEDKWLFSVQDNGIGIDSENKEIIFNIFQQLTRKGKSLQGTGIGLATCKKIVECHDGEIWVESEVGKGSTFYFTIPDKVN